MKTILTSILSAALACSLMAAPSPTPSKKKPTAPALKSAKAATDKTDAVTLPPTPQEFQWDLSPEDPNSIRYRFYDGNTVLGEVDAPPFTTPALSAGTHTLSVTAFWKHETTTESDKAGCQLIVNVVTGPPQPPSNLRITGAQMGNVSARSKVGSGDDILAGGIIITGEGTRRVTMRAMGPSIPMSGTLGDPRIEVRNASGTLMASNDDWQNGPDRDELTATGLAPPNWKEAACIVDMTTGNYTFTVSGKGGKPGIALAEAYAL